MEKFYKQLDEKLKIIKWLIDGYGFHGLKISDGSWLTKEHLIQNYNVSWEYFNMKPTSLEMFENGFVARKHNSKSIVTELDNGIGYEFKFMSAYGNKEKTPTCSYHQVRGVDCTVINISKETMRAIVKGILIYEREKMIENGNKN